jgi:hypothetical protein
MQMKTTRYLTGDWADGGLQITPEFAGYRGGPRLHRTPAGNYELSLFDGEDVATMCLLGRRDGVVHVTVVLQEVDSYCRVEQAVVAWGVELHWVNEVLGRWRPANS